MTTSHPELYSRDLIWEMICEDLQREVDSEAILAEEPYNSLSEEIGDGMTDVEADADTLKSCGWGTDEDYGGDYID